MRDVERTAGAPAALRLTAEVGSLNADSEDVAPIAVAVMDDEGNIVSTAENEIQFSFQATAHWPVSPTEIPSSHELNIAPQRKAFHGLAMVLVRAADHPGIITVRAQASGLPAASITIPVLVGLSSFAHHSQ